MIADLLPELARVEIYPQWSDGAGGDAVRRQRVTLHDATGVILGATREEHRQVLRALLPLPGDWDRPQTFDVAAGVLAPTFPVVLSLPEALGGPSGDAADGVA